MREKQTKAYLMLISSMLIFGSIGIFRHFIPLSSGLLACARGFLGALVLMVFVLIKGDKLRFEMSRKNLLLLILTGAVIGANWILLFEAYNYTTVAVASLCYYMEPTIVILLSPILFHEKLTGKKLLCALLSIVGMIFVSGVVDFATGSAEIATNGASSNPGNIKGILLGLGAAVLYSCAVILNKLIDVKNAYSKTIIQLFFASLVLVPYLLFTEDFTGITFTAFAVVMVLIVGIIHTGFSYAMYFSSIKALPAQSVAVLSYIDPVAALILSALILHEKMTLTALIGAVLIIGSALFSEINWRKSR